MYTNAHTNTQTHKHTRTHARTHARTHTHTHARTHARTHTHTYTYTTNPTPKTSFYKLVMPYAMSINRHRHLDMQPESSHLYNVIGALLADDERGRVTSALQRQNAVTGLAPFNLPHHPSQHVLQELGGSNGRRWNERKLRGSNQERDRLILPGQVGWITSGRAYISSATIHVVFGLSLLVIPRGLSVTLPHISGTPTVLRVYMFRSCIPGHPQNTRLNLLNSFTFSLVYFVIAHGSVP